jgi:hypothetical protein
MLCPRCSREIRVVALIDEDDSSASCGTSGSGSRTCGVAPAPTRHPVPSSNRGSTTHCQTSTPSRSWHTSTSERASDAR